jgi:hypothetical protein
MVRFSKFVLTPYYIILTIIILAALIYMVIDIFELCNFIWQNSKAVKPLRAAIAGD